MAFEFVKSSASVSNQEGCSARVPKRHKTHLWIKMKILMESSDVL